MFCVHCGKPVHDNARFCPICGKPQSVQGAAAPPPAPPVAVAAPPVAVVPPPVAVAAPPAVAPVVVAPPPAGIPSPVVAAPAPAAVGPSGFLVTADTVMYPQERYLLWFLMGLAALLWAGALYVPATFGGLISVAISTLVSLQAMAAQTATRSILVSERQLPELWAIYMRVARRLGLEQPPPLYVQQQGGVLNAFALRAAQRNHVVLTSSLLNEAGDDMAAIEFIIGHELGHHMARHTVTWKLLLFIPLTVTGLPVILLLGLKRMQEFTSDRWGLLGCGDLGAAERAMKLLIGGKWGLKADTNGLLRQWEQHSGFWTTIGEFGTTHPNSIRRLAQLREFAMMQRGLVNVDLQAPRQPSPMMQ